MYGNGKPASNNKLQQIVEGTYMFINIWGKKIWYEIYGTEYNDTLLYLHDGPGASCLDFVNQAKALSKKMKVIIFDQLGVLRSEAIPENESYSMEYQIEMIEEMRKLLGIEKWSILGHSYGGMLAVLYAYIYPNSIHKVIAIICTIFLLTNIK